TKNENDCLIYLPLDQSSRNIKVGKEKVKDGNTSKIKPDEDYKIQMEAELYEEYLDGRLHLN
ncbi:20828_t:CDS:2, partial [Rhizophagus irregularis]